MKKRQRARRATTVLLVLGSLCGAFTSADGGARSTHQMMRDCMAKQKASNSGQPKEDMKKACRDLVGIEKQNDERAAAPQK